MREFWNWILYDIIGVLEECPECKNWNRVGKNGTTCENCNKEY